MVDDLRSPASGDVNSSRVVAKSRIDGADEVEEALVVAASSSDLVVPVESTNNSLLARGHLNAVTVLISALDILDGLLGGSNSDDSNASVVAAAVVGSIAVVDRDAELKVVTVQSLVLVDSAVTSEDKSEGSNAVLGGCGSNANSLSVVVDLRCSGGFPADELLAERVVRDVGILYKEDCKSSPVSSSIGFLNKIFKLICSIKYPV